MRIGLLILLALSLVSCESSEVKNLYGTWKFDFRGQVPFDLGEDEYFGYDNPSASPITYEVTDRDTIIFYVEKPDRIQKTEISMLDKDTFIVLGLGAVAHRQ